MYYVVLFVVEVPDVVDSFCRKGVDQYLVGWFVVVGIDFLMWK